MTLGCPVGSLGLAEGRAQVQQGSSPAGPVPVRMSGEGWRGSGSCSMCQRNKRKTARDDLWSTGSQTQSQVEKEKRKKMMMMMMKSHQRKRGQFLQLTWQVH